MEQFIFSCFHEISVHRKMKRLMFLHIKVLQSIQVDATQSLKDQLLTIFFMKIYSFWEQKVYNLQTNLSYVPE